MSLLTVTDLDVEFATDRGWVQVLYGVDLDVGEGEVVGLVGESGSGKSVTSLAIMGLLPPRQSRVRRGRIEFQGRDLLTLDRRTFEDVRGSELAMVFQEPMTSLNPSLTVGRQIGEVVRRHRNVDRAAAARRAVDLLDRVGIPNASAHLRSYPHELSGGMRQRVMIAMALACDPKLLIADEPTTALDVTIQAQILDLLRTMAADLGLAMVFVTHDLGVVAELCDRVVVMYAGQVVERNDGHSLFQRPAHPYTRGLLAVPAFETTADGRLWTIPGTPPSPWNLPVGCRFAPRCAHARDACRAAPVELVTVEGGASSRCVRAAELDLSVAL